MSSDGRVAVFAEVAAGPSASAVGLAVDPGDDLGGAVQLTPEFAVELGLDHNPLLEPNLGASTQQKVRRPDRAGATRALA